MDRYFTFNDKGYPVPSSCSISCPLGHQWCVNENRTGYLIHRECDVVGCSFPRQPLYIYVLYFALTVIEKVPMHALKAKLIGFKWWKNVKQIERQTVTRISLGRISFFFFWNVRLKPSRDPTRHLGYRKSRVLFGIVYDRKSSQKVTFKASWDWKGLPDVVFAISWDRTNSQEVTFIGS